MHIQLRPTTWWHFFETTEEANTKVLKLFPNWKINSRQSRERECRIISTIKGPLYVRVLENIAIETAILCYGLTVGGMGKSLFYCSVPTSVPPPKFCVYANNLKPFTMDGFSFRWYRKSIHFVWLLSNKKFLFSLLTKESGREELRGREWKF